MPSAPRRLTVLRTFSAPGALDQQIRREVAADRDHRLAELAQRHRLADRLVDFGVGIGADTELVDAAVDDAVELVPDWERVVELQLPASACRKTSIITGTFIVLAA